jgi:hypothetical protein
VGAAGPDPAAPARPAVRVAGPNPAAPATPAVTGSGGGHSTAAEHHRPSPNRRAAGHQRPAVAHRPCPTLTVEHLLLGNLRVAGQQSAAVPTNLFPPAPRGATGRTRASGRLPGKATSRLPSGKLAGNVQTAPGGQPQAVSIPGTKTPAARPSTPAVAGAVKIVAARSPSGAGAATAALNPRTGLLGRSGGPVAARQSLLTRSAAGRRATGSPTTRRSGPTGRAGAHPSPPRPSALPGQLAATGGGSLALAGGPWGGISLRAATHLALPIFFGAAIALFLLVQAFVDRRDPRLTRAPARNDDDSVGFS